MKSALPKSDKQKKRQAPKQRRSPRKTNAVVASARKSSYRAPSIRSNGSGLTVSHREIFGAATMATSTTMDISSWTINPGWDSMFPWLSAIAQRYELYSFKRLRFLFRPRVPTSTPGLLAFSADLDINDSIPDSTESGRLVMLSYQHAQENNIWTDITMDVSSAALRSRGRLFVRTPAAEAVEPRTSDLGQLLVGIFGVPSTGSEVNYGDLIVEYTVDLFNPQLSATSVPEASTWGMASAALKAAGSLAGRAFTNVASGVWKDVSANVFDCRTSVDPSYFSQVCSAIGLPKGLCSAVDWIAPSSGGAKPSGDYGLWFEAPTPVSSLSWETAQPHVGLEPAKFFTAVTTASFTASFTNNPGGTDQIWVTWATKQKGESFAKAFPTQQLTITPTLAGNVDYTNFDIVISSPIAGYTGSESSLYDGSNIFYILIRATNNTAAEIFTFGPTGVKLIVDHFYPLNQSALSSSTSIRKNRIPAHVLERLHGEHKARLASRRFLATDTPLVGPPGTEPERSPEPSPSAPSATACTSAARVMVPAQQARKPQF